MQRYVANTEYVYSVQEWHLKKNISFILFQFSTSEICARVNSSNLVMTNNKLGQTSNQENFVRLHNCKWVEKDT